MSHPARGAWIEIPLLPHPRSGCPGRTPQGVRGLKCRDVKRAMRINGRTPQGVRGLKFVDNGLEHFRPRRTPQGVRGLK